MAAKVYTVAQINKYIKGMIDQDYLLKNICLKGEVSNCKYHQSGHIYFTLKDQAAAIQCVMFASDAKSGLKFRMADGDGVVVLGRIGVYETAGVYQVYVKEVAPDGGGELYEKVERLKKELEEMGMFAEEYKQPIPKFVKTVGIVTAETGAVIRDIVNVSTRRNPYVQLILRPSAVQGEYAPAEIISAIEYLDKKNVDVIIVGRGGGSIEDLMAFNDEGVARAIFECKTPIISAVGHETDFTIADFVADLRAPTPSAAAELAVFDIEEFMNLIGDRTKHLDSLIESSIHRSKAYVSDSMNRLSRYDPGAVLNSKKMFLAEARITLDEIINTKLERIRQYVQKDARAAIDRMIDNSLSMSKNRLSKIAGRMEGVSPLNRLKGGYSWVSDENGKNISSVKKIKKDDSINITVTDGFIKATVDEVNYAGKK